MNAFRKVLISLREAAVRSLRGVSASSSRSARCEVHLAERDEYTHAADVRTVI